MKNITVETQELDFLTLWPDYLSPRPHFHKHIEIIYVIEGKALAYADQKSFVINKGEMFIAFPNQVHYYEKSIKGRYIVILIAPELVYGMENIMYNNIPKANRLDKAVIGDYEKIFSDYRKADGEYRDTTRVGIINRLLAEVLPKYELMPRVKTNNTTLQSVLNYCTRNFAEDLTLESIAEALHISKFHISHLLNKKLGISFNSYLNNIRVHKACSLLNDSENKISDISEEVGFGSIRSFNRAFKTVMDMTPIEYRNQF